VNSVVVFTLVIATFLLLISFVQPAAERLHLPYSVVLAVVGVAVGGLSSFLLYTPLTDLFDDIVRPIVDLPVNASVFLVVFLPLLLFHAALTIDLREILEDIAPILTLAVLAVFAAAAAIGLSLSYFGVPLIAALLFGAVVATTDPAAVVAIFHDLGAPPRLTRLLEGESLLNDAAAIVLFSMLLEMLAGGPHRNATDWAIQFITEFLGGLFFGALLGWLFGAALRFVGGSRMATVTLSVAQAYIAYALGEHVLDISGVVSVVSAGLTSGTFGRIRLRPGSWRYLERVWDQTGFWASSLIFIIACTLVPKLVEGAQARDLLLLLVAIAAALAARVAVLFGVMPILSALRLSQTVSGAYKLAITWGGLRGAITLALALAVKENPNVDLATKDFVTSLATGFVLFTLLVNGLTLQPVIRLLKLDRLPPLEQAIRNKVLAFSLTDVRDVIRETAQTCKIATPATQKAVQHFVDRIEDLAAQPALEAVVSDQDRIKIGLVGLANRERYLILQQFEQNVVSGAAIGRLLRNTNLVIEATRSDGQVGYDRATRALLGFSRPFRLAHFFHRTARIDAPLRRQIATRYEALSSRRLALAELTSFAPKHFLPVLGPTIAKILDDVIAERVTATAMAIDALRLQYPDYADDLEQRFLLQSGFELLSTRYRNLFEEGLISGELLATLEQEQKEIQFRSVKPNPLDLGLRAKELIGSFKMFAGLKEPELDALVRLFRPRLLLPDEVFIRRGGRGRNMFFISSGAVEVRLPNERVRLGTGDFVGEMALLRRQPRQADVVSLGYGRVLELGAPDFERFLARYPRAKAEIERTAAARSSAGADVA
jgi:CPA1 family monovalent cation:H+ antiporter